MSAAEPAALVLEPLAMIAAMSRNRVIGNQGLLPWHEPEDARFFRATTLGHAIIMGRKTFESLGRALPKRRNIVITRLSTWSAPGAEVVPTLAAGIRLGREQDALPFITGGGEIYAQALPLATRIHLTVVDCEAAGDAFFPEFDEAQWRESERRVSGRLLFRTLERIRMPP
jgi:dihydrofolate reductase